MKVSHVRTKTLTAPTAEDLDGKIETFVRTLGEEQIVSIEFAASPSLFAVLITYTV